MNNYYPNNRVRISTTLTDSGGAFLSASSVALAIYFGNSFVSSINPSSISNPSTGKYYHDFDVRSAGEHIYRWSSFGAHISEGIGAFIVNTPVGG